MEWIHKFFRLPPHERFILAQACGLFLIADFALRILPFPSLLNFSKRIFLKQKGDPALMFVPHVSRLAWLVDVAGRYVPMRATCLKRALVLSWLLGRRGAHTELRIGVARQQGRLKAHAWLDYDGQVIFGHDGCEQYEPLVMKG